MSAKLRLYLYFFCCAWLLPLNPANAAAPQTLSWIECSREALQNNHELAAERQKIIQQAERKKGINAGFYPQLGLSAGQQTSQSGSSDKVNSSSLGLSARQLIFDGWQNQNNLAVASANLSAEEFNYAVLLSQTRLNLRKAFIDLLTQQTQVELAKKIALRQQNNLAVVTIRYEAGREHKGSLLAAQANLAQALAEVNQASRNILLAQITLQRYLGRTEYHPLVASGSLTTRFAQEEPPFEKLLAGSPLLQQIAAQKEAARYNLEIVRSANWPQVYLNGSYNKNDDHWFPENDQWSAGINLSYNLYDGNKKSSDIAQADAGLKQAEEGLLSGQQSVLYTLRSTWINLLNSAENVSVQKKFLEATTERAKIAEAQYEIGILTFDSWIIIEDSLVSAEKAYLSAENSALTSEAYWVQAQGGGLE